MPKPYSYDFRQKVIQAIELDGLKKCEASELFNISRNTINLWLQRKAQTGDVMALPNRPPGNNHKITDWEEFRSFAKTHGDIATDISVRTLYFALKGIGNGKQAIEKRPNYCGDCYIFYSGFKPRLISVPVRVRQKLSSGQNPIAQ